MIRVVKLGGSLLALPDLRARFARWLAAEPSARSVLIVGGGPAVDRIRERHAQGELDDERAHWAAVEAMRDNARRLLAAGVIDAAWVGQVDELPGAAPGLFALDPLRFLREADPRLEGGPLPASWDATGDTIAARVARALAADELALLKSVTPRVGASLDALSAEGVVDRMLPRAAGPLRVTIVNLRA